MVEFKENYYDPKEIGEYISALSNSACLHNKKFGYLVFGIKNGTHAVKGTSFKLREKKKKRGYKNWQPKSIHYKINKDFMM